MIIEKASLFEGMNPRLVDEIEKSLIEQSCEPGVFLFHQDDPAEYLYIVLEGRVRLSVGQCGLVTQVVSASGDAFGWSSVVDRDTYAASAQCVFPTKVAKIRNEVLTRILERDTASGMVFYKRLAKLIGNRLIHCYQLLPSAHGEQRPAPGG